jgi:cytochrome c oxidase subunit 4
VVTNGQFSSGAKGWIIAAGSCSSTGFLAKPLGSRSISVASTVLILLFYMHVRRSKPLLWVFVGAGFFWLGIMFVLAFSDFLTRGWR